MKTQMLMTIVFWLTGYFCFAQTANFEKAWELFKTNDLQGAKASFEAATIDNPLNGEAWLMRSMIANIYKKEDEAIHCFKKFCDIQQDIKPYISGYFFPEMVGFDDKKKSPDMLALMTFLQSSGRLDLRSEGHLLEAIAGHYFCSNNLKKSQEYKSKIGSVTDWQITGPFDNFSESGFNKNYGPIFSPDSSSRFTNKSGSESKWFRMIETYPGQWNDLNYHFDIDNSIIYAQTFCKSALQQDVVVRIGTFGSLKVWVNDKLLFSEQEERNNGMDTYIFTARLNEGYNRILLQTGCSVIDRNNFLVRISNAQEKIMDDLTFTSSYQSYTKDQSDFRSEVTELYPEKYFRAKIASEPNNLLNYILLAETYLMTDKSYLALPVIEEAEKLAPDCSYLLGQQLMAYLRIENRTFASKTIERLKKVAPLYPVSLLYALNEANENKDYDEAERLCNQLINLTGENEHTLRLKMQILANQQRTEEYNDLLRKAYAMYPENADFVGLMLFLDLEKNNFKRSKKILEKYFKTSFDPALTLLYYTLLLSTGDLQTADKYQNKLITYEPNAVGYYKRLGTFYYDIGLYDRAIEYFKKCQEFAPYTASFYESEGKCYEEKGMQYRARTLYRKAIKYDPINYDLMARLRKMDGKQPIFSYFQEPDFTEILSQAPDNTNFPNDNALILCNEVQHVVFENGGNIMKKFRLMKIFNRSGVDQVNEYYVPKSFFDLLTVERAEVIKPDGRKISAEVSYDHIVFTSLEVGDAVALIYRLENYQNGRFVAHFEDEELFSRYNPVKSQKYSLLVEKNVDIRFKSVNMSLNPEITEVDDGGFKLYQWESKDTPAVEYEPWAPALKDFTAYLAVASRMDWKTIANGIMI